METCSQGMLKRPYPESAPSSDPDLKVARLKYSSRTSQPKAKPIEVLPVGGTSTDEPTASQLPTPPITPERSQNQQQLSSANAQTNSDPPKVKKKVFPAHKLSSSERWAQSRTSQIAFELLTPKQNTKEHREHHRAVSPTLGATLVNIRGSDSKSKYAMPDKDAAEANDKFGGMLLMANDRKRRGRLDYDGRIRAWNAKTLREDERASVMKRDTAYELRKTGKGEGGAKGDEWDEIEGGGLKSLEDPFVDLQTD